MERVMGKGRAFLQQGQPWRLLLLGQQPRRGQATLAYEEVEVKGNGAGKVKTALVVHGLMGSGRNWRTVSKRLANAVLEAAPGAPGE